MRRESDYTESSSPFQKFGTPIGLSTFSNDTLNNQDRFLYVADRNNNAIRGLTATCSFLCENEGYCIGLDKCECKQGWTGLDCTRPTCSNPCSDRQVCVAPDQCSCIPGYNGDFCNISTCVQSCENGGICSSPDTCSCLMGWFDANCTTPVCEQTCGNGGNCTSPNTCSCPSEWMGHDCRTPVCEQECHHGGICIAPNTCQCPPDWSGFDCSQPVCHQGYFEPLSERGTWLEYRPCNMTAWCFETESFECQQSEMAYLSTSPLYGKSWR